MARAARLKLEAGERRVVVVRRHWWLLLRPALGLVPLLIALPLYAFVDYYVPRADLARYTAIFITVDLALCGLLFLKWLAVDYASWWADVYVITNRRLIEQRGVVTIERREANLRSMQESNYSISGAEARFFDFGDLKIQTGGRGSGMVFRGVPHPRRLQVLLSAQARAAREEHQQSRGNDSEINAALNRIFNPGVGVHDLPTQNVPRITRAAARMQQRLSLLPDEAVILATRRHPVLLATGLLPPLVMVAGAITALVLGYRPPALGLVGLCGFIVSWAVWATLDWLDDRYVVTTDRIMELQRKPIVFELRAVVQLRSVQDVVLRISSVSGRLFNLGTLTIETGSDPLELTAVPHPELFQRAIFEQIDDASQRDRLREQERLAGTLTEWFKEYHRMQDSSQGTSSP
jgi:PH (Pleckstrin Homology) domain-containing protein